MGRQREIKGCYSWSVVKVFLAEILEKFPNQIILYALLAHSVSKKDCSKVIRETTSKNEIISPQQASMLSQPDGPFITISKLNLSKYAQRPNLAKVSNSSNPTSHVMLRLVPI